MYDSWERLCSSWFKVKWKEGKGFVVLNSRIIRVFSSSFLWYFYVRVLSSWWAWKISSNLLYALSENHYFFWLDMCFLSMSECQYVQTNTVHYLCTDFNWASKCGLFSFSFSSPLFFLYIWFPLCTVFPFWES